MTDPLDNTRRNRRRPLAPMPGVRHVAAPVTPCSCRTGFFVHKGVPAVSVVESDRRRDAAVKAERDRWLDACARAALIAESLPPIVPPIAANVAWHDAIRAVLAAGIESGEPA